MVIEQVVTLGNLIVILIVIVGFVISVLFNTSSITSKIAVFVAATEMRFAAGDKKFIEHEKDIDNLQGRCVTCPHKLILETITEKTDFMKEKQIELRAELPIQLNGIRESISGLKEDIKNLRDDLALSKKG